MKNIIINPTCVNESQFLKLKEKGYDCTKLAPEQWMVVEWFRLKHKINIIALENYHWPIKERWYYQIINTKEENKIYGNPNFFIDPKEYFNSPQEATSAAIDYTLNNLT